MTDVLLRHPLVLSTLLKIRRAMVACGFSRLPGSKRLDRMTHRWVQAHKEIQVCSLDCKFRVDPRDYGMVTGLLKDGVYEARTTELFRSLLKPGMIILDIGANFGYFTVLAARGLGAAGHIYAFEPEPHNYELLVRNLELNRCQNVTPLRMAVSNEDGRTRLYIDEGNLGAHSFRQENLTSLAGWVDVETVTLDHFVETQIKNRRVDLIKIDVQGAEGLVVAGAEQTLRRNSLCVIMELWPHGLKVMGCDPWSLIKQMESYGFTITPIDWTGFPSADLRQAVRALETSPDPQAAINVMLEKAQGGVGPSTDR